MNFGIFLALAAKLLKRVPGGHLVAVSGAAAALATGLLLAAETPVSAAAAVTLVGFTYTAIYPTTLGMAGDRFPPFAGTVFGVLFSVGLIGGMTFPWAAGRLAQASGLRAGLALPLVGAAGVTLPALAILRLSPPPWRP